MLISAAEALNVMSAEEKSLATCGESLGYCHTLNCLLSVQRENAEVSKVPGNVEEEEPIPLSCTL